jgi:hypothetical protein
LYELNRHECSKEKTERGSTYARSRRWASQIF